MEFIKKKISLNSIRFGELSAKVSWLRRFFMESTAYRYCKRFDSSYWRNEGPAGLVNGCSVEIVAPDATVSATYPSNPSYGDVVVISSDAEAFNNTYGGGLSEAKQVFENGCTELENGGGKPTHFNVHVLLTEKYEDLGRFVGAGEEVDTPIPEIPHDTFTAFTDSKLETLKRRTKSYDIDGNELPFVLTREGKCEIPYTIGLPCNARMGLYGDWFYDIVNEIHFENEEGAVGTRKTSGTVSTEDASEDYPIICIKYEIGHRKYEDEEAADAQGVTYEEKYYYEIKEGTFNVTGRLPEPYRYIDVDYSASAGSEWGNVSAVPIEGDNESLGYSNFIFDEAKPLNLMGQFNSVEEIERYRNDLFKIGKENS